MKAKHKAVAGLIAGVAAVGLAVPAVQHVNQGTASDNISIVAKDNVKTVKSEDITQAPITEEDTAKSQLAKDSSNTTKDEVNKLRGDVVESSKPDEQGVITTKHADGTVVASDGNVDFYVVNDKEEVKTQISQTKEQAKEIGRQVQSATTETVAVSKNVEPVKVPEVKQEVATGRKAVTPATLSDNKIYEGLSSSDKEVSKEVNKYQEEHSNKSGSDFILKDMSFVDEITQNLTDEQREQLQENAKKGAVTQ